MTLHRWLQFLTAGLAVLGAGFLLLSGDRSLPPYLLAGGALVALFVTDIRGWIQLPRLLGNLAAIAAVAWSLRDFMVQSREDQLLTISHMLIYLQVVLIFQFKTRRVYWQLLVLSVLQVVVAAALSLGLAFGLLLMLYMVNALACMVLLGYQRDAADDPASNALAPSSRAPKSPVSLHRLLDAPSLVIDTVQQRQLDSWVQGWWLARSVLMFAAGSVVFAVIFFFISPRLSDATWQTARGRNTISGFSGEVVLRSRGSIKLSDQPVMRVSLLREDNRQPVPLVTEPYFHGQVLTRYHLDDYGARWTFEPSYRMARDSTRLHHNQALRPGDLVRQEIVLEVTHSPVLFSMMPLQFLPDTPHGIREFKQSPRLIRFGQEEQFNQAREYRFAMGTLAIRNGRQLHAVPHFNPAERAHEKLFLESERDDLRKFDADRFPGIKRVADEVIQTTNVTHESTLRQAIELRNHLFASGKFEYSLDLNDHWGDVPAGGRTDSNEIDPLEQFVVSRRRGHCEYFASALVMMLRSQHIPCRMVVGYKGGDWNALGEYYLVRQKHAHAWVEVLLEPHEVPLDEIAGVPSGGGAWYRLDPTPMSSESIATDDEGELTTKISDAFDYADYLWRDYVLGLNAGRQDSVLEPLNSRTRDLLPRSVDPQRWQTWAQSLLGNQAAVKAADSSAKNELSNTASRKTHWFRLVIWLVLVVAAPALVGTLLLAARALAGWCWPGKRPPTAPVSAVFLALKRSFIRLGVDVRPQATTGELLATAEQVLRRENGPGDHRRARQLGILETVVARYHRFRFGNQRSAEDERALERDLAALLATNDRAAERI